MENDDSDIILVRWNEISSYLGVSDRTAFRYAKDLGLPVNNDPAGHPWISKTAIDEWKELGRKPKRGRRLAT